MKEPAGELRFDGRVALVTGAGSGLGRAHARLLGTRGARVVVNDLPASRGGEPDAREERTDRAASVAREIESAGGEALSLAADVSDEEEVARLVDAVLARFGRLDVVVNNAGLLEASDFSEMSMALFDRVLSVNLRSAVLVSRAAWPAMREQGYGRIVSTTSNSGLLGTPGSSAYAAAKAGLWGLTRCLALEGAEHGIRVNAVAPIAYTSMSARSRVAPPAWRSGDGDAWSERLAVEQVAPAVAWLAHESCQRSGEVLSVAGGRVARFTLGLTQGFDVDLLTPEALREREPQLFDTREPTDVYTKSSEEARALHRRLMHSR